MSRLRVVFSIGAMHGGGSERQIVQLLTHLDRTQFEPFLYLVYRTGPLLSAIPDDVPVASFEERVAASRLYIPGLMHSRRVADLASFLREVRADVCYDRTFLMTLIAAAAAQRIGVPNVSTIVTTPETGFYPVAGRFAWFKRRMLRRLYNNSARVLAVSSGARDSAIRFYGLRGDNVEVHRNGVDVAAIQRAAEQPVQNDWWTGPIRMTGASRIVRIVSAGRLNHEKGFHLLLVALDLLRKDFADVEFRLALPGEGSHRTALEQLVRDLGLDDHVLLPGFQDNAAAWFKSADMFVLPSLVEGMPNVLLEAMVCGTPVIAADCPSGPAEILEDGRWGTLTLADDIPTLVMAMHELLSDQEAARQRASAARDSVCRDWTIEASCRNLEEVLMNLSERRLITETRR